MRVVMTHGTFDLLHYGHIEYLKKAKELGDYLIVLVTSDAEAKRVGKSPYFDEDKRMFMISSIKYVDKVILRDEYTTEKDIIDNNVNIFVATSSEPGLFDYLKNVCDVVYLDRTEGVSTTKIKQDLRRSDF